MKYINGILKKRKALKVGKNLKKRYFTGYSEIKIFFQENAKQMGDYYFE